MTLLPSTPGVARVPPITRPDIATTRYAPQTRQPVRNCTIAPRRRRLAVKSAWLRTLLTLLRLRNAPAGARDRRTVGLVCGTERPAVGAPLEAHRSPPVRQLAVHSKRRSESRRRESVTRALGADEALLSLCWHCRLPQRRPSVSCATPPAIATTRDAPQARQPAQFNSTTMARRLGGSDTLADIHF